MSQLEHTLADQLEEHLEAIRQGDEDDDWLRDLVEWLLQELLELEFKEHLGADLYERTDQRRGYRNGYRHRDLVTRVGRLTLRVPRDREGRFSTDLFERYQRSEKALVLALQESYLQGVSTRKVKQITEKLCGVQFSTIAPAFHGEDQVSRMAQELDDELETWRDRALEKSYPYLVVDAHYEYVREDGQVVSDGVLLVKGVDHDGYREILSIAVAPAEEEATWNQVFADLRRRGLDAEAVRYVVSDEHLGLRAALRRHFPGALWNRCHNCPRTPWETHYQRNAAAKAPRSGREEVHAGLRDVFNAPNGELARQRAGRLMDGWRDRFPQLVEWMEETIEQPLTVFELPAEHRKRLRTTNGLERFNQELRRRARVIRIFPNRKSCLRLTSALAMEQSEEWLTGHRYVRMDGLDEQPKTLENQRALEEVAA